MNAELMPLLHCERFLTTRFCQSNIMGMVVSLSLYLQEIQEDRARSL